MTKADETKANETKGSAVLPFEELNQRALSHGFTHCALLDVASIRLLEEVRQMCEKNTCRQYGKTWVCPPALGTLEECEKRIRSYHSGLLVQTVGSLEDPFDYDSMTLAGKRHNENLDRLRSDLMQDYPALLTIGAGGCTYCADCTYPDAPCRHPERARGSMEGYGMLVTEVCQQNHLAYYYGPGTIAYTGCFLLT